eukprot:gene8946-biopygen16684
MARAWPVTPVAGVRARRAIQHLRLELRRRLAAGRGGVARALLGETAEDAPGTRPFLHNLSCGTCPLPFLPAPCWRGESRAGDTVLG